MKNVCNKNTSPIIKTCNWREISFVLNTELFHPELVVLGAWKSDQSLFRGKLEDIILNFVSNGCFYLICYGDNAESLHDEIDTILIENDCLNPNVVTTFHDDESPEEVVDFLISIVDVRTSVIKKVLFISSSNAQYDRAMVKTIKSMDF